MTFENYIKGKLASFVAEEGMRYGGPDCALAIAQIIANRVGEGWQGGDWTKVIDDAPKYRGTIHSETFAVDPRDMTFRQILSGVEDIYHRTADDSNVNVTDDRGRLVALYYCELHNVNAPWFQHNILGDLASHPRLGTVGQLTVFA